jgi:hypothetical protein
MGYWEASSVEASFEEASSEEASSTEESFAEWTSATLEERVEPLSSQGNTAALCADLSGE